MNSCNGANRMEFSSIKVYLFLISLENSKESRPHNIFHPIRYNNYFMEAIIAVPYNLVITPFKARKGELSVVYDAS